MLSPHLSFPETLQKASSSFWPSALLCLMTDNQSLTLVPSPSSRLQGAFPHTAILSSFPLSVWNDEQGARQELMLTITAYTVLSLHRSA